MCLDILLPIKLTYYAACSHNTPYYYSRKQQWLIPIRIYWKIIKILKLLNILFKSNINIEF